MILESEKDARRVYDVPPKRLEKCGLTLHPEKIELIDFRRPNRTLVLARRSWRQALVQHLRFAGLYAWKAAL